MVFTCDDEHDWFIFSKRIFIVDVPIEIKPESRRFRSATFVCFCRSGFWKKIFAACVENIVLISVSITSGSIVGTTPLFRSSAFSDIVEHVGPNQTDTTMFQRMMSSTNTRTNCPSGGKMCSLYIMEASQGKQTIVRYDVDLTKKSVKFVGTISSLQGANAAGFEATGTMVCLERNVIRDANWFFRRSCLICRYQNRRRILGHRRFVGLI